MLVLGYTDYFLYMLFVMSTTVVAKDCLSVSFVSETNKLIVMDFVLFYDLIMQKGP